MSSVNVYFHAMPEELLGILRQWLTKHELFLVMMYLSPDFIVIEVRDVIGLENAMKSLPTPRRVGIGLQPPRMNAASMYEFMINNPEWSALDLGELTKEGLKESQFAASTEDPEVRKFWVSLAKHIKKATKAGLWAVNPHTGKKHFYKQNRFTPGAEELARTGKKLLPVAGWNYYQIDEPES